MKVSVEKGTMSETAKIVKGPKTVECKKTPFTMARAVEHKN